MTDRTATIAALKKFAVEFRDRRNWERFHDPKNLSTGLSIEAAELQELFLWKTEAEVKELLATDDGRRRTMEEMADIFIFLLYLSEGTGIDLSQAVLDKIEKNEKKYPVDKSYNSNKKYTEL